MGSVSGFGLKPRPTELGVDLFAFAGQNQLVGSVSEQEEAGACPPSSASQGETQDASATGVREAPVLHLSQRLGKQLSDIYAAQMNAAASYTVNAALASELARRESEFARIASELAAPVVRLAAEASRHRLGLNVAKLAAQFDAMIPENWRGNEISWGEALRIVQREGIPLVWVPDGELVRQILGRRTPATRRTFLLQRRTRILDHCRAVQGSVDSKELSNHVALLDEANRAVRGRYPAAGQALAANVLDAALRTHLETDHPYGTTAKWHSEDLMETELAAMKSAFTQVAVGHALIVFWHHRGDPIPTSFSRHATAHTVSSEQYTTTNAVHSIMVTTAYLRQLQEDLERSPQTG